MMPHLPTLLLKTALNIANLPSTMHFIRWKATSWPSMINQLTHQSICSTSALPCQSPVRKPFLQKCSNVTKVRLELRGLLIDVPKLLGNGGNYLINWAVPARESYLKANTISVMLSECGNKIRTFPCTPTWFSTTCSSCGTTQPTTSPTTFSLTIMCPHENLAIGQPSNRDIDTHPFSTKLTKSWRTWPPNPRSNLIPY